MIRPLVVIAAADPVLRDSVVFLMTSAQIEAAAYSTPGRMFASTDAERAVCAIVDHETAVDRYQTLAQIERFGRPVIFLVSVVGDAPETPWLLPLAKPFLGRPLIDLVRKIISDSRPGST